MVYPLHGPEYHERDSWKRPCRAATTANITIATALNNADVLDGVTLATGDRVLVKDQTTASQNGVYIVGATPARAVDFASTSEIVGAVVAVTEGSANADKAWICTADAAITVGTTPLPFVAFGSGSPESQLLPDNDANFTSTIGSWTASAGTLVRDATAALSPLSASLLFTPGTTGAHIDLPIAGTFKAGVPYIVVLIVRQGTGADTFRGNFGLIGTDATQWGDWALITDGGYAISMRWVPTADRTGVSIRWTNLAAGTVRVYAARLYQAAEPPIVQIGYRQFLTSAASTVTPWMQFGVNDGGNLILSPGGARLQGSPYDGVAVKIHDAGSGADSYLAMYAEHNPADFADYGINIETGVDYVGLNISEKDAGTVQIYADYSSGYDIELKDRGSGFWKMVTAAGVAAIPSLGMLPQYAAAPGSPVEGQSYYDTVLHKTRTWNGSSWNNHW